MTSPLFASRRLKAVGFDVDRTLYDWRRQRRHLLWPLLRHPRLLRAFSEEVEALRGQRVDDLRREICRRIGDRIGRSPDRVKQQLNESVWGAWLDSFSPRVVSAGLPELLRTLDDRGIRRAVVSDHPAERKLAGMGLGGGWAAVIDCTALGALKPLPDGLLAAAEAMGLSPEEVLYIGDREDTDGAMARAAGSPVLILGRDFDHWDQCARLLFGPDYTDDHPRTHPMNEPRDPFRNLEALRHKLAHHSARVHGEHAAHFACKLGCDGCCQTERTVTDVEFAALQRTVAQLPEPVRASLAEGRGEDHCSLLVDGRCAAYSERPLICRSHGLPLVMDGQTDVCPLNFTELDIAGLPEDDLLSVDNLTAILVAVNHLYCKENGGDPGRRREVGELLES